MLNDDEISCEWPSVRASTTTVNVVYCTSVIKLSQLISEVLRRLSTVEAFRQSPSCLAATVADLDREKTAVETYTSQYFSLDSPTGLPYPGSGLDVQQVIYLRLLYYVAVSGIHTVLTNPWSHSSPSFKNRPDLDHQVKISDELVAKTSRDAILATQYIRIDVSTPLM